jgi:drug/metabolite transporter (DMT)-like permease
VRRWADAALVWNTLIWGATFVVVKAALADVSPILFLALRFSVATAALLPLLAWRKRRAAAEVKAGASAAPAWSWRAVGAGALAGVFLFSGFLCQTIGLRYTSAPKSALSLACVR